MSSVFLFVYGTMLKGCKNHYRVEDLEFVGAAITRGVLFHRGNCPAMKPGQKTIHGEVYKVHLPRLSVIDTHEGFAPLRAASRNVYNRVVRRVSLTNGLRVPCHLYLFNLEVEGLPEIENGIYSEAV